MKQLYLKDYQTRADILWKDFIQLQESIGVEMDIENVDADFLTMRILNIFYDIRPSDIKLLMDDQKELLMNKIFNVLIQPKTEFSEIIKFEGIEYGIINFETMKAGEYIDLDMLYNEVDRDLIKITSIIYRPIIGYDKNGKYILEDYNGYNDVFRNVGINIIEGYIEWLGKELSTFKSHFPDRYLVNSIEEGDDNSYTGMIGYTEKEAFLQEYGAYMEYVYILCNGDMLKKNEVFNMLAYDFMFTVDYLIKKTQIENKIK